MTWTIPPGLQPLALSVYQQTYSAEAAYHKTWPTQPPVDLATFTAALATLVDEANRLAQYLRPTPLGPPPEEYPLGDDVDGPEGLSKALAAGCRHVLEMMTAVSREPEQAFNLAALGRTLSELGKTRLRVIELRAKRTVDLFAARLRVLEEMRESAPITEELAQPTLLVKVVPPPSH